MATVLAEPRDPDLHRRPCQQVRAWRFGHLRGNGAWQVFNAHQIRVAGMESERCVRACGKREDLHGQRW
ncbi:hypothetical protein [Stenotrophomonas sp. SAU14A_NAIMI4_8]|uniref:hypothetical protein n=1 Tax=Stenotrophomonas sp. SAU14A_NAIMI4_8 TaxID=2072409 RepID=UPI00131F2F26|nr:hypothetical protein [Stenotrophomonas sp. SAU14A_NAIMI4_8]